MATAVRTNQSFSESVPIIHLYNRILTGPHQILRWHHSLPEIYNRRRFNSTHYFKLPLGNYKSYTCVPICYKLQVKDLTYKSTYTMQCSSPKSDEHPLDCNPTTFDLSMQPAHHVANVSVQPMDPKVSGCEVEGRQVDACQVDCERSMPRRSTLLHGWPFWEVDLHNIACRNNGRRKFAVLHFIIRVRV